MRTGRGRAERLTHEPATLGVPFRHKFLHPMIHVSGARALRPPIRDQLSIEGVLRQTARRPIRHPEKLVLRDHQVMRLRNVEPLIDELSVLVENLYPMIASVRDVQSALGVNNDAMREAELSLVGALGPPGQQE